MKMILVLLISILLFTPTIVAPMTNNDKYTFNDKKYKGILQNKSANHQWPMYKHDPRHTGLSEYDISDNPGVEKWKYFVKNKLDYTAVIDKDGILYVGSSWDELHAVYPNGTMKWIQKLTWPIVEPYELAIDPNGNIYMGSDTHFSSYYSNGTLRWILDIGEWKNFVGYPIFDSNGTVYTGTSDGYLYAIYQNGTLKWRNTDSGDVRGPALDNQGNVYFTSRDFHLYCINPDGTLKWKTEKLKAPFDYGPVIGDDGTIYALPRDNWLYAFNPDGSEKWGMQIPDGAGQVSIAPDGNLIICGLNDYVVSIDPNNCNILWTYPVDDNTPEQWMTNAAIGSDGTIFFAYPKYICALNPDGILKWKTRLSTDYYPYDGMSVHGGPSISSDGTVYVTTWFYRGGSNYTDIGYIHAIGEGNPDAPIVPVINGKQVGKPLVEHEFSFNSTSPVGNDIFYVVDWGDGKFQNWVGPYPSGKEIKLNHSWETRGNYRIEAMVKDVNGLCSPWGDFEIKISISRNRVLYNYYWMRFLELFPFLEKLLFLLK
jgi:outer membrane protein assembly factor BamB